MSPQQKFRLWSKLLTLVFCLSGCLYQIIDVCVEYFKYKTTAYIMYEIPEHPRMPILSVCVRLHDILDRTNASLHNIDATIDPTNYGRIVPELDRLKVSQIFDLTPHENQSISSCRHRDRSYMFEMQPHNASECYQYFHVTKYLVEEYMCYTFQTIKIFNYSRVRVTHAATYNGIIYKITLGSRFNESYIMKVVAYAFSPTYKPPGDLQDQHGLPKRSRDFAKHIRRYRDIKTKKIAINQILVYESDVHINYKEPPYDTKCVKSKGAAVRCLDDCLTNGTLKLIDRLPATQMIKHNNPHIDKKRISPLVMKYNESIPGIIDRLERDCTTKCSRQACLTSISFTSTYSTFRAELEESIEFVVMTSEHPDMVIEYHPRKGFMDTFIYLASAFGIWFGISIVTLDPLQVIRRGQMLRRRLKRRQSRHTVLDTWFYCRREQATHQS